jgi:hypothetical protein
MTPCDCYPSLHNAYNAAGKLLETLETLLSVDWKPCDHTGPDGSYYGTSVPETEEDWQYAYCPKCGEEL